MKMTAIAEMVLIAATLSLAPLAALAGDPQVARGKYLATAGDCAACHGADLSGGDKIASPLGAIYASNITPDRDTGIGTWTEAEFADALRKGRAPGKGWLYPAMPYTSYTGLTDADVKALFAYVKSVKPVHNAVPHTDLGFPFLRPAMAGWNMLYLKEGRATGAIDVTGKAAQHGRYLVETLGHCSACHSPRGDMMQQDASRHLGGGSVNGWTAPNITPGPGGIGDWSDAQLAAFLSAGHNDMAVAGGEMGLAVERSLSKLSKQDISDIVTYLRAVPAVASDRPAALLKTAVQISASEAEHAPGDWRAKVGHDSDDGMTLYQGGCSSCHGMTGQGGAGPDLSNNHDVRMQDPSNLLQVIAHGIDRTIGGKRIFMPGFDQQMSDQQMGEVANFVRTRFAGQPQMVMTSDQVGQVLSGTGNTSWLLAHAALLIWIALAVVVIILLGIFALLLRRRKLV